MKSDYHPAGTEPFNGWNRYSISQLGGVPEVVLTIGQVPYTSSITGTTKYLPVSISIIAAEGCGASSITSTSHKEHPAEFESTLTLSP